MDEFETRTVIDGECSIGMFDGPVRFACGECVFSYRQQLQRIQEFQKNRVNRQSTIIPDLDGFQCGKMTELESGNCGIAKIVISDGQFFNRERRRGGGK